MASQLSTTQYIIIGTVIVVISGISLWAYQSSKQNSNNSAQVKNIVMMSKMMEGGKNLEIQVQPNLQYFTNSNGYLAKPKAAGTYPGIVMIHENRGLRPEIKTTADNLAKEGYTVLAVDLLGGVAEDQVGAKELTSKFSQETGTKNMQSAVKYLKDSGVSKVATLGWCFGGKQAVNLSISGEKLDATVVYYGGSMATSMQELQPITWPVLGVFGDEDKNPSPDQVKTFEESLNTLGIKNEIYSYPKVGHAFANPSGANYAPEPTADAWKKTLAFLNNNLK
jgi:carboxymethylenebutenolidase